MTTPKRMRRIDAAAILQQHGYGDVAKFLLARDKKTSHKKRAPRATRVDLVRDGKRVRGGKAWVNMHNEQIEYVELSAADEQALKHASDKAKALFKRRQT